MKKKITNIILIFVIFVMCFTEPLQVHAYTIHEDEFVSGFCLTPDGPIINSPQMVKNSSFQVNADSLDSYAISIFDSHTHNYVKGYYKRHTLKTDGGCVVATYNAQICTICGTVILGSLYSTATYPVCPH